MRRTLLRTDECHTRYLQTHRSDCPFCSSNKWKIVPNTFPYDAVAERHDMLVAPRHVNFESLTKDELYDMRQIIQEITASQTYDAILWNTPKNQTVPGHFHIHLILWKEI